MNRFYRVAGPASLALLLLCAASAGAQQKCPAPPVPADVSTLSIFTPQQEVELGDIEAERVERTARVIHDDQLSAYMNRIVSRILSQLPPTQLQFRVTLIDTPVVNAFSLPGGRIYVTRKIVAFTRNDDELADLLGHEMGHILSHQGAIDTTREFREVLGVTSVGDREDIAEKLNRLLDNLAKNPDLMRRINGEEEPHQYQADRVALYAVADAGYSAPAFASFFDRLAQTKGKSGDWFSDFLGMTTPNEKRLRQIHNDLDELPAACREQPAAQPSEDFLSWQADVIAYSGLGRKEVLSGLLDKKVLDPPLRPDITNLKFSPDGKYVLAQDDSSIFVLSRDPLRLLFRIDAPDSHPAQFTSNSQDIVFDTRGMRVEDWNIADEERSSVHELALPGGCVQTLLSPDGKTLACIDREFDLSLYDVGQGSEIFAKKACFSPGDYYRFAFFWQMLMSIELGRDFAWVHTAFSPDSRTFLAASEGNTIAVDVTSHEAISIHGALPDLIKGGFAFLAPDTVIALNQRDSKNSAIMQFPSGEVKRRLPLGGTHWAAATHGQYLIVGPLKDVPVGVLDLTTLQFAFASKDVSSVVDAYDQTILLEARNGEIALFNAKAEKVQTHTSISLSPLGRLRAGSASPDLKWIALSGDTRGAVWNLSTAKRTFYTRRFDGAYFDGRDAMFADYPKLEPQDRSVVRLDLNASGGKVVAPIKNEPNVRQYGPFLVTRERDGRDFFRGMTLEIRDVQSQNLLWSRAFPKEIPEMTFDDPAGTLMVGWPADTSAAKDELKSHPTLQDRLAAMRDRKGAWLLEDLNARTGAEIGALVVDTGKGSFRIENAYAVGDFVVIVDTEGRTLVYSIATGEQKAAIFGTSSILSQTARLLAVENEPGNVDIYAVPSFEKRGSLVFSSPVALWWFSDDGKRLLVLTKSQTAYTFDTSQIALGSRAAAASQQSALQ